MADSPAAAQAGGSAAPVNLSGIQRERDLVHATRARLNAAVKAEGRLTLAQILDMFPTEAPEHRISVERALAGTGDFEDLRRLSNYARVLPDGVYLDVVRKYDPGLRFPPIAEATFTGKGHSKGFGSLNAYRMVSLGAERASGGIRAFEKTYDAGSPERWRAQIFYADVAGLLRAAAIPVAGYLHRADGDRLCCFYTDFLNYTREKCPDGLFAKTLARVTAFSFTTAELLIETGQAKPEAGIRDFTQDPRYASGRAALQERLASPDFDAFCAVEAHVGSMPRLFAHGDLSRDNVTRKGALLDIDMWGMYPPFYDIALQLAVKGVIDRFQHVQDYVDHVASAFIVPRHREDVRSLIFLTLVFRLAREADSFPDQLLAECLTLTGEG